MKSGGEARLKQQDRRGHQREVRHLHIMRGNVSILPGFVVNFERGVGGTEDLKLSLMKMYMAAELLRGSTTFEAFKRSPLLVEIST